MSLLQRRMMLGQEEEEMKEWELIADITIDETCMNVSITEDMNGNSFKLSEVEIFLMSVPTELTTAGGISACTTPTREGSVIQIGTAALSTDTKRYGYGLWKKTGIGMMHIKSMQSNNGKNAYNTLLPLNGASVQMNAGDEGIATPDFCTGIWIGSHYQSVLSTGSTIKVYGVKA